MTVLVVFALTWAVVGGAAAWFMLMFLARDLDDLERRVDELER